MTKETAVRRRGRCEPMRSSRHQQFLGWRIILGLVAALGLLALSYGAECAPVEHFPAQHWERAKSIEALGWSPEKLAAAKKFSETIDTAAVFVVDHGVVVVDWGDTDKKYNVHSIRKSLLSALYGIEVSKGTINLASTMEELGIDDSPSPLTAEEKQARVIDLLKARSGIYHTAAYETPSMTASKPPRGSHPPNTFWHYNNWDFNALGTIFEHATKMSIFDSFEENIAKPTEMEDYSPKDGHYEWDDALSIHKAYPFSLTARDMARFGLLFLHRGAWRGKQIIPEAWVKASSTAYSVAEGEPRMSNDYSGYGFLWWIAINGNFNLNARVPDGSFAAEGYRGHYIIVIPSLELVIVHRVDTDKPWPSPGAKAVGKSDFGKLLQLILDSKRGASEILDRSGHEVPVQAVEQRP